MAVVVDDELVAYALGFDAGAGGAEGAEADGDLEEAVLVGADGGEGGDCVVEGEGGGELGGRGGHGFVGAAREEGGGGGGGGLEEVASVHGRLKSGRAESGTAG